MYIHMYMFLYMHACVCTLYMCNSIASYNYISTYTIGTSYTVLFVHCTCLCTCNAYLYIHGHTAPQSLLQDGGSGGGPETQPQPPKEAGERKHSPPATVSTCMHPWIPIQLFPFSFSNTETLLDGMSLLYLLWSFRCLSNSDTDICARHFQ